MIAKLEFTRARPRSPTRSPRRSPRSSRSTTRRARPRAKRCATLGGLHILGTERHESRRIDNQLRGRAGRQGDPGSSRFYLSLEDDLMRIFAGDRVKSLMERMGMPDNEPIVHPWVTQEHPGRAAQGRGAQLRHPQAPARIRRRDERAAQDGLQAAPAAAPRHLQARDDRRGRQAHRQDARDQDRPAHRRRGEAAVDRHGGPPRHADRRRRERQAAAEDASRRSKRSTR